MNRKGKWSLSPAYDITFSYNPDNVWLKAHQMKINNKTTGITRDDLLATGANMGIGTAKVKRIINEVNDAVSNWEQIAKDNGIRQKTIDAVSSVMLNSLG